ncbi:MAG: N-acetylmuramic acid 6-phosphate etherase [Bacteroidia bacterium]|nr:N-acetylmuramic acid 6-phosphate etherase [Bacteroidia bacterium]NNJ56222.1 N-acetylmuramic acid 6-phosphate etherase [Bacteroidia bacterium]
MLTTETTSNHDNLDQKSTLELLQGMNQEDKTVPLAIEKELGSIQELIDGAFECMKKGGRLFYLGSGTSGRLGVVDASECPPTYGVPQGLVVGIIAGGETAIRKAVEHAEDDPLQGWYDLQKHEITSNDFVIGISASGTAPYVQGALSKCKENDVPCGAIACNTNSKIGEIADYKIEVVVGPEYVTGSTRMKSGTAQKLVLNMISTSLMIKLGHVQGNKMVDMQLSNKKLVIRGTRMIMEQTGLDEETAKKMLIEKGSVRKAVQAVNQSKQ